MAEEIDNQLLRSKALFDVLSRKAELERLIKCGVGASFEFLTSGIEIASHAAVELSAARKLEKSAFPLRARAVNLAARYLRIVETIDRQKDLGGKE